MSNDWLQLRIAIRGNNAEALLRKALDKGVQGKPSYDFYLLFNEICLEYPKTMTMAPEEQTERIWILTMYAALVARSPKLTMSNERLRDLLKRNIYCSGPLLRELLEKFDPDVYSGDESMLDIACKTRSYDVICQLVNDGKPIDSEHPDYDYIVSKAKQYKNINIANNTFRLTPEYLRRMYIFDTVFEAGLWCLLVVTISWVISFAVFWYNGQRTEWISKSFWYLGASLMTVVVIGNVWIPLYWPHWR